jgi:hypothetical protein
MLIDLFVSKMTCLSIAVEELIAWTFHIAWNSSGKFHIILHREQNGHTLL